MNYDSKISPIYSLDQFKVSLGMWLLAVNLSAPRAIAQTVGKAPAPPVPLQSRSVTEKGEWGVGSREQQKSVAFLMNPPASPAPLPFVPVWRIHPTTAVTPLPFKRREERESPMLTSLSSSKREACCLWDSGTPELAQGTHKHGDGVVCASRTQGEAQGWEEKLPESCSHPPFNAQTFDTAQLPSVPLPPPQDVQPPTIPTLPPSQLPSQPAPSPELRTPPTTVPQPPETVPGNPAEETLTVKRFEVVGSTVFSREQLAKVTAPYTNRPLTLAEFFQVRDQITQLYLEKGYINSGAFIPPQKFQDGVVRIQVVEGGLEDIKVTGTRRLNPGYVRSRIALATIAPLNRDRLLEALQLLKLNPLIKNLSAEISTGSRPGVSLLTVQVTEAQTFSLQTTLDNGRSPSVGSQRRVVELGEANLLGLGDGLSFNYTNTDGSNTEGLSYTLPINPRNGTVSFSYTNSDNHVIERPFNTLDINSSYQDYALTLRQPIFQTPSQEFALSLTASRRNSRANLLGGEIPFPLPGADNQGRIRVSALRFAQEYSRRSGKQVLALRSQFNIGVDALGSTINRTPPDSRFFAWRGQAQLLRLLGRDTLLLVRTDLQLADRALVDLEQFGLGGIDTVRGYRQDRLLSDNGFFASAEVRVPVLRLSKLNGVLQIAPFIDVGTAWNNKNNPAVEPHTLASVGLGLRLQLSDRFSARLDYGIPLVPVSLRGDRTLQERGLYFSINFNPL